MPEPVRIETPHMEEPEKSGSSIWSQSSCECLAGTNGDATHGEAKTVYEEGSFEQTGESPAKTNADWGLDSMACHAPAEETPVQLVDLGITRGTKKKCGVTAAAEAPEDARPSMMSMSSVDRSMSMSSVDASCAVNKHHFSVRHSQIARRDAVVQFTCKVNFSFETDPYVSLPIIRSGGADERSEVSYSTKDASAKAGANYVHQEGTVAFEPGETVKYIQIEQINNHQWDQTKCFCIELQKDDLMGAVLHNDLCSTMVFQIDLTPWPSMACRTMLQGNKKDDLNALPEYSKVFLLFEYIKFAMNETQVWRRTRRAMLVDIIRNAVLFVELLSMVYLIDNVISTDEGVDSSFSTSLGVRDNPRNFQTIYLIGMAVFYVASVAILHFFDYTLAAKWPTQGLMRLRLQGQVLRQFLHFTQEARDNVSDGEVIDAMMGNIFDIVGNGVVPAMKLPGAFGRLVAVVLFKIVGSLLLEKPFPSLMLALCCVAFPLPPVIFMIRGGKRFGKALQQTERTAHKVTEVSHEMVNKFTLINTYNKRGWFQKEFENKIKKFNIADVVANAITVNNDYFLKWVTVILLAFYMVVGGLAVVDGSTEIGMFMANIEVIKQVGNMWREIFDIAMDIQRCLPSFNNVVNLMNEANDYQDEAAARKSRSDLTSVALTRGDTTLLDMPIIIDCLLDGHLIGTKNLTAEVNFSGRVEIRPGQMVCLVGEPGMGKGALLKLVSGVTPMDDLNRQKIHVPAHMRVLHLTGQDQFLARPLLENLKIGTDGDISLDIIRDILVRLGISSHIVEKLDSKENFDWERVVSETDAHLLSIVRALLANYELLILHRPVSGLTQQTASKVMDLLQEFVALRGIGQDPSGWHTRSPRTCIISCIRWDSAFHAGEVYHIHKNTGINCLPRQAIEVQQTARNSYLVI